MVLYFLHSPGVRQAAGAGDQARHQVLSPAVPGREALPAERDRDARVFRPEIFQRHVVGRTS